MTLDNQTKDEVSMFIPAKSEYVGVVRLTAAAISNKIGFNVEDIQDIKVALSEACSNAIRYSKQDTFKLTFYVGNDNLRIMVSDDGEGCDTQNIDEPDLDNPKESGLGLFIIKSLMDEVSIESDEGEGTVINMIKFLEDAE